VERTPRQRLEDLEIVYAALAHAARRQILLTVHFWGGVMTAGDIARRFGHSWPTTTRHLRLLTDAGLLTQERDGRARLYRLNAARLGVASAWLQWFDKSPAAAAAESMRAVAVMTARSRLGRREVRR
jgi:DNA-binding transcriptional ArsR family regulator